MFAVSYVTKYLVTSNGHTVHAVLTTQMSLRKIKMNSYLNLRYEATQFEYSKDKRKWTWVNMALRNITNCYDTSSYLLENICFMQFVTK